MEVDYNSKSEQWLQGMQNSPIFSQIEKIDMTAAACESAEKVLEDTRPTTLPTLDKSLQEQQTLLRAAVNVGDGYYLNCQYSCFVRSSCSSFLAGAFKFCTLVHRENISSIICFICLQAYQSCSLSHILTWHLNFELYSILKFIDLHTAFLYVFSARLS
ncbi:hypothetical protein NC652_020978 [Populus alba x Populus x berolinensis]|nr:hypothetical protein NC652_020978 [Populus alba x Populus x berolinensis]